jgi:DnaJ-class molecular chaperone
MAIVAVVATERQEDSSRLECSPCRGTGTVISALGGEPREVTCPWCGGSGRFIPGRDAQHQAEHGNTSAAV